VGGLDLAAMCGAYLGAAASKKPAVIDGYISAVAALCALRLCPAAEKALFLSHSSGERGGEAILADYALPAPIRAGMRLGEGSGAVMLLPLLDMALSLYHSGQSFDRLGIEAYTPQK
jgi:nicotinate-nucleotide--dimethylbenzimidazole phosphoribosyltransferase